MKVQLLKTLAVPNKDAFRQKWILTLPNGPKARILTKSEYVGHHIQGPNPTISLFGIPITAHSIVSIFLDTKINDGQEIEVTEQHLEIALEKGLI